MDIMWLLQVRPHGGGAQPELGVEMQMEMETSFSLRLLYVKVLYWSLDTDFPLGPSRTVFGYCGSANKPWET